MMALSDFDDLTDEAFAFLRDDFGYQASPTEVGGRFNTACARKFTRGDLTIVLVVGDADSSDFCSIFFDDGIGAKVHCTHGTYLNLATLLEKRQPEFSPPSLRDLPSLDSQVATIWKYASLLREFASDVVDGDFSALAEWVFVLFHVDRQSFAHEVRRLLGAYSSLPLVEEAIEIRRQKPGYVERQGGFEIWRLELDGYGGWYAGIPLDRPDVADFPLSLTPRC